MEFDTHERARFLIEEALVAQIPEKDLNWLETHLEECGTCRSYQELSARIVSGLHSLSFETDPDMTRRVQEAVTRRRTPTWTARWVIAAAVLIVLLLIPVLRYALKTQQERADALLLERVDTGLSREVPAAMEPLTGGMR